MEFNQDTHKAGGRKVFTQNGTEQRQAIYLVFLEKLLDFHARERNFRFHSFAPFFRWIDSPNDNYSKEARQS